MTNPIYLSVVLSTYNDENYIAESINSILNQSYPYFEFIIVNDGSTDDTLKVIKSFKDPRIILIDKPNSGLINSLNIGVKAAKYDWIARMDGDDIAEPNRFEEEVKYIKTGVAVVSSQCNIIDSKGSIIGKTKFMTSTIGKYFSFKYSIVLIAHPTVIFNKHLFNQVGGYDKNMYVAEDYDLWTKMLAFGKLEVCNKRLLNLRKHNNNISAKGQYFQQLNSTIGVVKRIHKLNRSLTELEYTEIKELVLKSNFYNTRSLISGPVGYVLHQIYLYYACRRNKAIKEYVRNISI